MKSRITGIVVIAAILLMTFNVASAQTTSPDIVDAAVADGRLGTLLSAVQAAGLLDTLREPGPYTVFAPTDTAFARIPSWLLEDILAEPDLATLADMLLFHVVPGRYTAADLASLGSVPTALGESAPIRVIDGETYVAGARIVASDIETSNGVIHVIDLVMIPDRSWRVKPAETSVRFDTPFYGAGPLYYNGFDYTRDLTFSWNAYPFADENGAYRISIRRYLPAHILGTYSEMKVAYHFAASGETYTYGEFGVGEVVCLDCPSYIVVEPVTFTQFLNPATGAYEYAYSPISGAAAQWSDVFVFLVP